MVTMPWMIVLQSADAKCQSIRRHALIAEPGHSFVHQIDCKDRPPRCRRSLDTKDGVDTAVFRPNVRQSEPTSVLVGTRKRDGTVIKTRELNVWAAPRQLARDLSRSAAEIENRARSIESLHSEIGEPPDGQVTRIGRRKRIVTLRREHLVMKLAIAGRGPRGETPAELTERTRDAAPGTRHTNMLWHPDR
jgi:hypothetical protein